MNFDAELVAKVEEYLEMDAKTEVAAVYPMRDEYDALIVTVSRGAKSAGNLVRPMFEVKW